jgi:hypothetical protein
LNFSGNGAGPKRENARVTNGKKNADEHEKNADEHEKGGRQSLVRVRQQPVDETKDTKA